MNSGKFLEVKQKSCELSDTLFKNLIKVQRTPGNSKGCREDLTISANSRNYQEHPCLFDKVS